MWTHHDNVWIDLRPILVFIEQALNALQRNPTEHLFVCHWRCCHGYRRLCIETATFPPPVIFHTNWLLIIWRILHNAASCTEQFLLPLSKFAQITRFVVKFVHLLNSLFSSSYYLIIAGNKIQMSPWAVRWWSAANMASWLKADPIICSVLLVSRHEQPSCLNARWVSADHRAEWRSRAAVGSCSSSVLNTRVTCSRRCAVPPVIMLCHFSKYTQRAGKH